MATIKAWVEPISRKVLNERTGTIEEKIVGYRARYRDAIGKKHDIQPISRWEKETHARKAKDEWLAKRHQKAMGKEDLGTSMQALFEQWIRDCRSGVANKKGEALKESTIETLIKSLKEVVDTCPVVGELTREWVKDYVGKLTVAYKSWTVHRRLTDLKSFCNYLRREELMSWNPFDHISISRPKGKPRFYSNDEIEALNAAAMARGDLYGLLYLRLGYLCGLRHDEAKRLELEDLRRDPEMEGWGSMTIWADESKTKQSGEVPVPPKVMELIVQLCAKRKHGRIFEGWSDRRFEFRWARIVAQAGLPPAPTYIKRYAWARVDYKGKRSQSPYHGCRHTFIRRSIESGADLNEVKGWTRHKSIQILSDTYGHLSKPHQRARARDYYERAEKSQGTFGGQVGGKLTEIIETMGGNANLLETHSQGTNSQRTDGDLEHLKSSAR